MHISIAPANLPMNRRVFFRNTALGLIAASALPRHLHASDLTIVNVVLVGNPGAGKSSLTLRAVTGHFVEGYSPEMEDVYRIRRKLDGRDFLLEVFDTATDEFRHNALKRAHVVFACHDLAHAPSFAGLESRWGDELRQHAPSARCVLVGCKSDLPARAIREEDRAALAARLGWKGSVVCSAKTGDGIGALLDLAARHSSS